jgi:hypothetical protein
MQSAWDHPLQHIPAIVGKTVALSGIGGLILWLGYLFIVFVYGAFLNWRAKAYIQKNGIEYLWEKDKFFDKNLRL